MVAVFVVDSQLHCDFINPVAELLTGLSIAEARHRPLAEVICAANPRDFEHTYIARVLKAGGGGEGEETLADRSGDRRPFAFRVVPLGGQLVGGSVIELTDLSDETGTGRALRESERRLRLAVEATGIGIWEVNAMTGERRWSDEFKTILGLPLDSDANEALYTSLIHPDDRDRIVELYRRAYEPGSNGIYNAEHRILRANDGAERWVAVTGRIAFDKNGQPMRGVGTLRDIHQRRLSEERQHLIVREMNHRVKNTLAVVQAVVSQTIRMSPKPSEAFERIQSRLMAMSRTHELLNASEWPGTSLRDLLKGELDSSATGDAGRISLAGPLVVLDSSTALALGLIFHELATNAAKHGSLSTEGGHLDAHWSVEDSHPRSSKVTLTWVESGGPPVRAPRRPRFGSRLIEGSAKGNLGGSIETVYAPAGVRCTLVFELKAPAYESQPEGEFR